ncbi:MAG: hypothetical protein P3C10_10300 [Gemmatimonadota bacterium]|nr:hypothetical protein [Gemmatimonadota bacterium]
MKSLTLAFTLLAVSASARPVDAQQPPRQGPPRAVAAESAGTVGASSAARKPATMPTEIVLQREVFAYNGGGRRDPYTSLMTSSDVRPLLSDLRLTAVAFDPVGNNSVAILRDTFSKQQYRIRVGQQLGRLRVAAIRQRAVQFTIEEFGFNRQETLPLSSDTTKVRNP